MKKFIISFLLLLPSIVFAQVDLSLNIKGRYIFPLLNGLEVGYSDLSNKQFAIANVVYKESLFDRTILLSDQINIIIDSENNQYDAKAYGNNAFFMSFKYYTRQQSANFNNREQGSSDIQIIYSPNDNPQKLYAFVYLRDDKKLLVVDLKEANVVCTLASNIEVTNIDVFSPQCVKSDKYNYNDIILLSNKEKLLLYDKLPSEGETSVSNIKAESNKINSNSNYDISGRRVKNQTYGRIIIRNDGKKYRVN